MPGATADDVTVTREWRGIPPCVRLPGPAGALFGDEPTTGEPRTQSARTPPQPTRRLGFGILVRRASALSLLIPAAAAS
jgi:hypothetical protein